MATWEKGTIQDALDRWSFSDQYGLSYISVASVELKIGDNNWENLSDVYVKDDRNYTKLNYKIDENLFDFSFYKSLPDLRLSIRKSNYNRYYRENDYYYQQITLSDINIKIKYKIAPYSNDNEYDDDEYDDDEYISCEIEVNDAENFLNKINFLDRDKKVDFWLPIDKTIKSSDSPIKYFDKPNIKDVEIGYKYFYPPKNSICEVVKKYDYPDPDNRLYDVRLADKSIVTIDYWDYLLVLPYKETENDLLKFDEFKDEFTLQPYIVYTEKTYNVYWQEIKNAARYIVSVYTIIKLSNKTNIYHCKDIEIDRNEKMASIDGLLGENFVFVVKAEDRNGNVVACSRGILNQGVPIWEKGTIQDALNTWSFSDQYGLSYISVASVELKIGDNNWINLSDVYVDNRNYTELNYNINENLFDFINFYKNLLKLELCIKKSKYRYDRRKYYYYKKITLSDIKINFQIAPYSHAAKYNNYKDKNTTFYISCEIEVNDVENFLNKINFLNNDKIVNFWIPDDKLIESEDDSPIEYFDRPNIKDVEIGDKYYYYPQNSICEVVKKYDYPDLDDRLFDVKLANESIVTIKKHDDSKKHDYFLVLPYVETKNDLLKFNEFKDEFTLQPYVECEDPYFEGHSDSKSLRGVEKTYNVYWHEIKNAARYIVSVYTIIKLSNKTNIYHCKDIEIDRNEKMAIIDGLVGENFVFVVKAEDRNGNVVACSRGILNQGEPQWWR
ncbi:MAG TPA: hypothetical protein PLG16_08585 [Planctomycetota bacterium]|nr:hypothetical protein [Planctomycetota bacterium]